MSISKRREDEAHGTLERGKRYAHHIEDGDAQGKADEKRGETARALCPSKNSLMSSACCKDKQYKLRCFRAHTLALILVSPFPFPLATTFTSS